MFVKHLLTSGKTAFRGLGNYIERTGGRVIFITRLRTSD